MNVWSKLRIEAGENGYIFKERDETSIKGPACHVSAAVIWRLDLCMGEACWLCSWMDRPWVSQFRYSNPILHVCSPFFAALQKWSYNADDLALRDPAHRPMGTSIDSTLNDEFSAFCDSNNHVPEVLLAVRVWSYMWATAFTSCSFWWAKMTCVQCMVDLSEEVESLLQFIAWSCKMIGEDGSSFADAFRLPENITICVCNW